MKRETQLFLPQLSRLVARKSLRSMKYLPNWSMKMTMLIWFLGSTQVLIPLQTSLTNLPCLWREEQAATTAQNLSQVNWLWAYLLASAKARYEPNSLISCQSWQDLPLGLNTRSSILSRAAFSTLPQYWASYSCLRRKGWKLTVTLMQLMPAETLTETLRIHFSSNLPRDWVSCTTTALYSGVFLKASRSKSLYCAVSPTTKTGWTSAKQLDSPWFSVVAQLVSFWEYSKRPLTFLKQNLNSQTPRTGLVQQASRGLPLMTSQLFLMTTLMAKEIEGSLSAKVMLT